MALDEFRSDSTPESHAETRLVPLVVDLDGTLVRTDTLWECLILFVKFRWMSLWQLPIWLLRGKAWFKHRLAREVALPVHSLPRNEEFLAYLRSERAKGRPLILATAADETIARAVAEDEPLFDHVLASSADVNLSGARKLAAIEALVGHGPFDYAANASVDLAIWRKARRAILVDPSLAAASLAPSSVEVESTFDSRRNRPSAYLKAMRLYQWPKNVLVFLPIGAAHRVLEWPMLGKALLAFLTWSLCASAVYLMNDLLDLASDREHPKKRSRPFAAGDVSIARGVVMIPLLLAVAGGIAALVGPEFLAVLTLYFVVNVAYSGWIKRIMLMDVMIIAGVYTLRVIGGAVAVGVVPTFWLLAFSMFLFLDLSLVKRYADLVVFQASGRLALDGRDYQVKDLPLLIALGASAGPISVLVLALYINSPEIHVLYRRPEVVWLLCPILLYWTSRMWMKAVRGEMHHDPLIFALTDRASWLVGALSLVVLLVAI